MFSMFNLTQIKRNHVERAALQINSEGIPGRFLYNQYWVVVNDHEYPFKYLLRIAYQQIPGNQNIEIELQSQKRFRNYIESLGFHINYYREWINFFKQDELLGLKILPLAYKTEAWLKELKIPGFTIKTDFKWQISGHFKPYTWARIFRTGDQDKNIFFTIGVSAEEKALIYKLDCLWSQTNKAKALPPDKVEKFRKYTQGSNTAWIPIHFEQIIDYDWDRLIIESKRFIEEHIQLYDDVINYVWGKNKPLPTKLIVKNELRPHLSPTNGYDEIPPRKPSFKGTNRDFLKEAKRNKSFGDAGEQLVISYERNLLIKEGKNSLADKVQKVADGKGYDILSYYPDKKEKHIEVKTTTSSQLKPFPISWTEIEYMKQPMADYFLYRLYNYDPLTNSADFYILQQNVLEQLILRELNFEAFIKSNKQK
jgi:hypothetical protein